MEYIYVLSIENKCKFCDWTAETGTPTIAITESGKINAFCPVCFFELEVSMQVPDKEYIFKKYKHDEWDFEFDSEKNSGGFDDRVYTDLDGNPITGILEGFYGYTTDTSDEKNCQYVENGKRKLK